MGPYSTKGEAGTTITPTMWLTHPRPATFPTFTLTTPSSSCLPLAPDDIPHLASTLCKGPSYCPHAACFRNSCANVTITQSSSQKTMQDERWDCLKRNVKIWVRACAHTRAHARTHTKNRGTMGTQREHCFIQGLGVGRRGVQKG